VDIELARAMLDEARHDLRTAEALIGAGEHARSVQHSAEAAEKAAKCLLVLSGRGTVIDHRVGTFLLEIETDDAELREAFEGMARSSHRLERYVGLTRYPRRIGGRLVRPSTALGEREAMECIAEARAFLEQVPLVARRAFGVEVG
jgi:HEPN domain-containing protein